MIVQRLLSGVILGLGLAAGEYLGKRIIKQVKEKLDEKTAGSEQLQGDDNAAPVHGPQCEAAGSEGSTAAEPASHKVASPGTVSVSLAEPPAPVPVVRSA